MVDRTEDWSDVRSPSRARRRRARGFPQRIKVEVIPKKGVLVLGDKMFMHPAVAMELRAELARRSTS